MMRETMPPLPNTTPTSQLHKSQTRIECPHARRLAQCTIERVLVCISKKNNIETKLNYAQLSNTRTCDSTAAIVVVCCCVSICVCLSVCVQCCVCCVCLVCVNGVWEEGWCWRMCGVCALHTHKLGCLAADSLSKTPPLHKQNHTSQKKGGRSA